MLRLFGHRACATKRLVANLLLSNNKVITVHADRLINSTCSRLFSNKVKEDTIYPIYPGQKSHKKPIGNELKAVVTQNDPDVFGTFENAFGNESYDEEPTDEGDADDAERDRTIPFRSDQLPITKYQQMIKKLLRDNFLKDAIDILEVRMPRDRVKPQVYIYELLIIECGRVGYMKKAFQLYNQMKKRQVQPNSRIFGALFNACAKWDRPVEALSQARGLRKYLIQKGILIHQIVYNNMIKAFGRCNDIETAFELVDEMKDKRMELHIDTINHLLHACISDKEYGFRNGLLVWHSIYRNFRLTPNTSSFNLLLRCTRDCGIGDLRIAQQAIAKILHDSETRAQKRQNAKPLLTDGKNENSQILIDNEVRDEKPNLISEMPHLGSLLQVNHIETAADRFFLLGGIDAIIGEFERSKARPDVKSFTQMMDMIAPTEAAEFELIEKMSYMRVRADTDFFNMLMKRRCLRREYDSAKVVLKMMKKVNLDPDIATYGILAMTCQNSKQVQEYFHLLEEEKIRANITILGALMRSSELNNDIDAVTLVLKYAMTEEIKPNQRFCETAGRIKNRIYKKLQSNESSEDEQRKFNRLYAVYKEWRNMFELNTADLKEERPWQQYKDSYPTGIEKLKNSKIRRLWGPTHVVKKLNPTYLKRIHKTETSDASTKNEKGKAKNAIDE